MSDNLKPSLLGPNGERQVDLVAKIAERTQKRVYEIWNRARKDFGQSSHQGYVRDAVTQELEFMMQCLDALKLAESVREIPEAVPASGERPAEITPHCPQCQGMIFAVNGGESKVRCSQFGCGYEGGIAEFFQDKKSSPMVSAASPEFDHLTVQSATPGVAGSAHPLRERREAQALEFLRKFCGVTDNAIVGDCVQVIIVTENGKRAAYWADAKGEKRRLKEVLAAFAESLSLAPPESPGPRCPKCGSGEITLQRIAEPSMHPYKAFVQCEEEECEFDVFVRNVADFAQFFPTLSPPHPAPQDSEIKKLADFLLTIPGEPSAEGSAVDCAIQLLSAVSTQLMKAAATPQPAAQGEITDEWLIQWDEACKAGEAYRADGEAASEQDIAAGYYSEPLDEETAMHLQEATDPSTIRNMIAEIRRLRGPASPPSQDPKV